MSSSTSETPVPVLIDRLTSATSPSDASASLSSLLSQCKKSSSNDNTAPLLSIVESEECLTTLTSLISTGKLPNNSNMEVDDGPSLSCELILSLLQSSNKSIPKTLLSKPSEGMLLNALLDALCSSSTTTSSYTRILSMEILRKFSTTSPHATQTQLLSAPDGMNRLVDLLLPSTPEEIRNEALLLHTSLATNSGACARLILFGEGYDKSLSIATAEAVNKGSGGEVVVQDCLKLCLALTKSDEMGCELLLGSSECLSGIVRLLDLRMGRRFRFPNEDQGEKEGEEEEEDGDDLDDLLKAGTTPDKAKKDKKVRIPYLTSGEEQIFSLVLDILELVIRNNEDEDGESANLKRLSRIKRIFNTDLLLRSVVDLAMYTHPPPNAQYVSGVPPLQLQHQALNVVSYLAKAAAALDNSGGLQEKLLETDPLYLRGRVPALDRLMYLVCTGGFGGGDLTPDQNSATSIHALNTFRSALSTQSASLMVLHTLAPPPPLDDDSPGLPPEPPVVQKLVNTLAESSMLLCSNTIPPGDLKRVMINMVGAAGALGTFMTNGAGDTTREMLLRVPINLPPGGGDNQPTTLMECILQYVEYTSSSSTQSSPNDKIQTLILSSIMRLLSEWVPKSPIVVSALLSSHCSTCLGILLKKPPSATVQALVGLLLGLCMENMEDTTKEYAGWNRESIMSLITNFGVGKFTSLLENLKKRILGSKDGGGDLPWSACELECKAFGLWFGENVNVVRRRMVQELAGGGDEEDSEEEEEGGGVEKDMPRSESFASGSDSGAGSAKGGKSTKTLSKLVAQQSSEIESLREALAESERLAAKQASELKMWKRRVESNPTQLDEMMNEFTEKNAVLESSCESLKGDMQKMQEEHEKAMKEKESVVEKLQTELKESREREEEARGEIETLREEMEGLSAAYSSLEGEYNRVANGNGGVTSAPAAAPTGEGESTAASPRPPAPAGEVSHQETSSGRGAEQTSSDAQSENELSNLRTENTKLRNDIRAANEWMSMAVGRMEEMGAQTASLDAEVRSLREAASSQQQDNEQQQRRNSVEHADKIERLRSDLIEARTERDSLRMQIRLQKDVTGGKQEKAEENMQMLTKLNAEKEAVAAAKEAELQSMQVGMEQSKQEHEQAMEMKDAEVKSLREGMKLLEERISGKEGEIQSRDAIIKDMEQRLSNSSTATSAETSGESSEEVAKLRKELESYKTANESAQAWMANAVVHHETLSNQVQELQEANAKLLADGTSGVASVDADADKRLEEVTQQLNEAIAEAAALRQESEDYRFEVAQHETKKEELVMRLEEQDAELKRVRDENAHSHEDLRMRNEELERIRRELDAVKGEATVVTDPSEIISLKEEIQRLNDKNAKEVASKEVELGVMHDTVQKLQDDSMALQSDMEKKLTLKEEEIKSRDVAIAQFEKQMRDQQFGSLTSNEENAKLKLELASLQSTNQSHEEELQRLNDELDSARGALLEVQDKLDENDEKRKEIEEDLNTKMEEYEALMNKNTAHQATIDDLKSKLEDFQSWAQTAQERIAELESDKDAAEQLADSEKEEKDKIESALQESEAARTELQVQLDAMASKESENQAIIDEAEILRSSATKLEAANKELADKCESLEMNLEVLNSEKADMSEKIATVEDQLVQKVDEVSTLQKELGEVKDRYEQITTELQGKFDDLQSKTAEIESENEGLRSEAEQAISEWEARCSLLQGELDSASEKESALAKENTTLNEQIEELATGMKELEEVIDDLQSQVADREKAASSAEEQIEALTQELNIMNDQSEEVVNQWRERTEELEETIAALEQSIEEQESAANEAITQWEARCNTLNKELDDSEYSIAEKRNLNEQISGLTTQLEIEKELKAGQQLGINNLTSCVDSLQIQVDVLTKERDTAVQEKSSIAADFEKSVQEAAAKLLSTQHELDVLKTRYEKLVEDMDRNTHVLNNEKQVKTQLEEALSTEKQSRIEEKKQSESILKDSETKHQMELEKNRTSIASLENKNRALEEKSASAQKEIATMKETIEQLEEDLQEANSALQSHLTDEVSTRAAEMATHAVRNEISELRLQHASDQEALQAERKARIQAEQQVEKLSADIAILAPVGEEGESIDSLVRKTASKASDENMKREKQAIKDLRSALDRAMEELAVARKSERDAEERAASSRLHASVCEQELMAAKSDIDTLTQSIEETREAEINTRSSLEYRINALEDDHDALIRSYTDKMDILKADLSQLSMEKERLMHALKESEKANEALVYSTSVENEADNDSPEKSELVMLRMEKVQLLAAVSEASARTERRVREAVATCASSYEADLIVERELREAAEATLGDVQAQMEEMNNRSKTSDGQEETTAEEKEDTKEEDSDPELKLDKLKHDLQSLQVQTKKLQTENQELKKKLKTSEVDNKTSQDKLLQRCRDLEEKIREFEREGHYEAAVAAEIARLRSESANAAKYNSTLVNEGESSLNSDEKSEKYDNNMTVEDLYDHVFELKSEIREERMIYRDLLAEHEDLLALLAQQDLERASLHEALFNAGGEEAVENAIQEAEEKALNQFGKYIKVR